jgi:preprotein translocase subunit SecA
LLTDKGVIKAEELFGVTNLYDVENAALSHRLDQALKANYLFARDVDYIVRNDEVVIVDEFTGRLSEGKRYSEGMHQALEAKEGVLIKEESQTLADITFQNYFRLYKKLAGMTGTAQTEATEFSEIYGLDVISIPTNMAVKRKDLNDLIYKTEEEKFEALLEQIKKVNITGQPILIGTASIEKSEIVHNLLMHNKISHTVLNAKNHEKEAEIIKQAGLKGAITVATNMAGRGVDVRLGDGVRELGGLAILGTERHESRRIDNQLRGRSGRQGDVGVSQFFLSLDDTLLRIFGSDKIKNIMNRLGLERGECIDSKIVTNAVEKAQKRVEGMNYESRKHLLEYDDVANAQRKIIYTFRNELLDENYDVESKISENRLIYASHLLDNAGIFAGVDEYDFTRLSEVVLEDCGVNVTISGKEYSEILEALVLSLATAYNEKMSVVEEDRKKEIERILILQILDEAWREHLYQMDILKTGIGLRGYNQKDPLTEYKKESYRLFAELIETIKINAMRTLHAIRFEMPQPQEMGDAQEVLQDEQNDNAEQATQDKRTNRQKSYEKKKSK